MVKAYQLFPKLVKQVKKAHEKYGLTASGHDFDHDLRVANYALMIAPDARTGRLAAAAGFCHSADHLLRKDLGHSRDPNRETKIKKLIRRWLENTDFTNEEGHEVVSAVLRHETANKKTDTLVDITLKDADRLANLDADVIIRGGQFRPHLLAVDPINLEHDPAASYYNPRSVLRDIENCILWTKKSGPYVLRFPRARKLGKLRAAVLQFVIDSIHSQRKEAGLIPYPEI